MKKRKVTAAVRAVVFVLILAVVLSACTIIFQRKSIYSVWNYTVKLNAYQKQEKNTYDVLAFGSSHMYCTLNPLCLWNDTGIKSHLLSTQQQPVPSMYYLIKEALKTQSPKLIIVELRMALNDPAGIPDAAVHDLTDNMPYGLNRLGAISSIRSFEDSMEFIFTLVKYHDRWKEMDGTFFDFSYLDMDDPYRGYIFLREVQDNATAQLELEDVQPEPLPETNMRALDDIVELAREMGIELLFLLSPYEEAADVAGQIKTLHEYADEKGVDFLDFNTVYDELGIDNSTDYFDKGHFNASGAEKASGYIGRYILDNYDFQPDNSPDPMWEADFSYYLSEKVKE